MKFIQAINRTTSPRIPNILTYLIKPPVFAPFSKSLYRRHLDMGWRNTSGLMLFRVFSSVKWEITTSFTRALIWAGPTLYCNCTNACQELFPQFVSWYCLTQGYMIFCNWKGIR